MGRTPLAFTVLAMLLFTPFTRSQELLPQAAVHGPVDIVRFIDGDTIRLVVNGVEENVRLIGVDTPETVHPQRGVEPYGREASAFLTRLLSGKPIWVEFDVQERDHYGRPLAYVYFEDPSGDWDVGGVAMRQANLELARSGLADVSTIAPNVRYAEHYRVAVRQARQEHLGMWAGAGSQSADTVGPAVSVTGDRDCSHFASQREAQTFFLAAQPGDPHRLDADADGIACESLK